MFGIDDMYPSVKELNQFDETDNLKTKQYDNPEPDVAPWEIYIEHYYAA